MFSSSCCVSCAESAFPMRSNAMLGLFAARQHPLSSAVRQHSLSFAARQQPYVTDTGFSLVLRRKRKENCCRLGEIVWPSMYQTSCLHVVAA
jgi:hypothetical protein